MCLVQIYGMKMKRMRFFCAVACAACAAAVADVADVAAVAAVAALLLCFG